MSDYIPSEITFYNEAYPDSITLGPTNYDYGAVPLDGSKIGTIAASSFAYLGGQTLLGNCLINSQPGTAIRLYNLTDGAAASDEVQLTADGHGFWRTTTDLNISLASGVKWYVLQIHQLCSGDSISWHTVKLVLHITKEASGTKVFKQIEVGSNYTVTGTTHTESTTNPKRYLGWDAAAYPSAELIPYAVLKAAATRTASCSPYSSSDAGEVTTLSTTSTSYTGVTAAAISAPTDGTELSMRLWSSAASTVAYQKCCGLMAYMTQPSTVREYRIAQKYQQGAVISATSYTVCDPPFMIYDEAADHDTLSGFVVGGVLLAGASGTTYAQLYDWTSAIGSTEFTHNTTTRTLVTLGISNPLDPSDWFNFYFKRATSNGRSYHTYMQYDEAITYPAPARTPRHSVINFQDPGFL